MEKPNIKPDNPNFSSGPCAKRPGWSIDVLKNTPIGKLESIDMLKFLEHEYKVRIKKISSLSFAVDNKEYLKKVSNYINKKK